MRGRRVGGPGLQARISTSGPQAAAPGRARVPRAIPTSPGSPRTHHGVDGRDPAYKAHRGLRVIFLWNRIRWPLFCGKYAGINKAREASNATRPFRQVCSVLPCVICLIMSLHCSSLSVFVALPINAEAALPAMPPLGVQSNPQACPGGANFAYNYRESIPSIPSLSLRFEGKKDIV